MIISRTPFRISFFGGGTDYPAWTEIEEGAVLSTTIDKYCYITCRYFPPWFTNKHRIVWSHIEVVSTRSEILHPAVREGMRYMGFDDTDGLEIHHQGDLPARTGVGTSSSFSVGLIKSLTALRGQMIGKQRLAEMAIELEQKVLKETVGAQDQVAAAYGGLNVIRFRQNGAFAVEPVVVAAERRRELESNLMLLFTGTSRLSSELAGAIVKDVESKADSLRAMRAMVNRGLKILTSNGPLDDFGYLLDEAWQEKRKLSKAVSNPEIDSIYKTAIKNGALGGKLLGAGTSGFMLFYVPVDRQPAVKAALPHLLHVSFAFEFEGSSIIYYGTSS